MVPLVGGVDADEPPLLCPLICMASCQVAQLYSGHWDSVNVELFQHMVEVRREVEGAAAGNAPQTRGAPTVTKDGRFKITLHNVQDCLLTHKMFPGFPILFKIAICF